jgi:hypothetical protein
VASVNGHGLGEVYEPTAISLLKQNDMIVAATGIYRLFTSPDSAWGLRTGVSPRLQGKGLFTSRLLPHLFDLVEGLYGGKRLHFFTEDEHNEPVKRQ